FRAAQCPARENCRRAPAGQRIGDVVDADRTGFRSSPARGAYAIRTPVHNGPVTLEARVADRQVPFDETAEQHVIGSLLIDRDAIFKVADLLRVDDFYAPRHQRIYAVAQALLERRERIDPLTIQLELARREELDRAGGQAYLRALAESVPTAAEIERY